MVPFGTTKLLILWYHLVSLQLQYNGNCLVPLKLQLNCSKTIGTTWYHNNRNIPWKLSLTGTNNIFI